MVYKKSDFENIQLDENTEVATLICGSIAKKVLARFKCKSCTLFVLGNATTNQYFHYFSRGNLTIPLTLLLILVAQPLLYCITITILSSRRTT